MTKQKIYIIALACLIAAAAFAILQKREFVSQESEITSKLIFPSFPANEIHTMVVSNTQGTLTLKKRGVNWVIVEKDDYLADVFFINEILNLLSQVSIIQDANAQESHWEQLGLLDPKTNTGTGAGHRLDLYGSDGYHRTLVVGSLQPSDSEASLMFGEGYDGRNFVRDAKTNKVYLVAQSLSFLDSVTAQWMMNIQSNPRAYRNISFIEHGQAQWRLSREQRGQVFLLYGGENEIGVPLPSLSLMVDYIFASMIIRDVMPVGFDRKSVDISMDSYFELESLSGAVQRIYLGRKAEITEQDSVQQELDTGMMRPVRGNSQRFVFLDWLNERAEPPPAEPPYSQRTYRILCPKMDDFMINYEEMLVFESLSPGPGKQQKTRTVLE